MALKSLDVLLVVSSDAGDAGTGFCFSMPKDVMTRCSAMKDTVIYIYKIMTLSLSPQA